MTSEEHPSPRRRGVSDDVIDNWTAYHPPTGAKIAVHEEIRRHFNETLKWLNSVLPEGSDKTNALQVTRHAMNAANTAVACNTLDPEVEAYFTPLPKTCAPIPCPPWEEGFIHVDDPRTERVQAILSVDDRRPEDAASATQVMPAIVDDSTQLIPRQD